MPELTSQPTRCREIAFADLDGVASLLTKGDRNFGREYWTRALRRLSEHPTPPGFPKYGYMLEHNKAPVGVLLLIYSSVRDDEGTKIRCNESSWYVEPEFRSYGTMLALHGRRHPNVTYFDVTPSPHTFANLEARGYKRYCEGLLFAMPALSKSSNNIDLQLFSPKHSSNLKLPAYEIQLLTRHAGYGCITLVCGTAEGSYPFVFAPYRQHGIGYARLIYCRSIPDFRRFAGKLGRFLARRGLFFAVLDCNGPVEGVSGKYVDGRPKYFKGPDRPRLGDLAYSELAMFRVAGNWIWSDWPYLRVGSFMVRASVEKGRRLKAKP